VKRRYKEGDWIRVPLDAQTDAIGIIACACRSRLFGYFFGASAAHAPTHDELKALKARDAAACSLFGGAGLEDARWQIVATSLPFDREAWPFPQFVSRGAFGRVWTRRIYDPQTMRIVETHEIDEMAARDFPDARCAGPDELEEFLRERICGDVPSRALAICEVNSGFEPDTLHILSRGGRVQFSEPLTREDLDSLAGFVARNPDVELRVHGFSTRPFDLRTLSPFQALRALTVDARQCVNVDGLTALSQLHRLRIGAQERPLLLQVLTKLSALRDLELHGQNADVEAMRNCPHLENLTLIDTPPIKLQELACAQVLQMLTIAHVAQPLDAIASLPHLKRLEVRDAAIAILPDLSRNTSLQAISLRNIRDLRDLTPLSFAPALREVEIAGSRRLNVDDFRPLLACPNLSRLRVEIGSRRKEREVYRLVHLGRKGHEVFRRRHQAVIADGVDDACAR
jgi:hypothetical protein